MLYPTALAFIPVKFEPSPWYEPLNEPEPALANVDISEKDAVAVGLKVFALIAIEADCIEPHLG